MIAALLGRKSTSATRAQLGFQWASIVLAVTAILGIYLTPRWIESSRLSVIDLATGSSEKSSYFQLGQSLTESLRSRTGKLVKVHLSEGAVESHDRLLTGEVDFAFLQANALDSARLKVLAPLYPEAVLIVLRKGESARSIQELKGKHIALGTGGSGMRLSSRKLLKFYRLSESDLLDVNHTFADFAADEEGFLDGAIVTIKQDNPTLVSLLKTGNYRILKLSNIDKIPDFRPIRLSDELIQQLPSGVVPEGGRLVPATFAILAVRAATADRYVVDLLEALYAEDGLSQQEDDVMSLDEAAEWQHLTYHEASSRFFSQARQRMKSSASP
jgi:hypothetical protein